jgi:type I restriction enzyme, S subunit
LSMPANRIFPLVPLGEIALPVERRETPVVGRTYRQIGVRLWGEGAYEREPVDGGQTKYRTLSRVAAGDIIVNKIWARNGSVGVVTKSLAGSYGSNEFPTFTPIREKLDPRWVHWLTKTKDFWAQCAEKSRGTSGKNRIRPERFLEIKIPLPPLPEQRRIVARIEELAARIEEARELRRQAAEETEVLWTAGAQELFAEPDGQGVPLRELVTVRGGGTPSKKDPTLWGGEIPWVSPKDMKSREIERSIDYITKRATQESSAKLVDPGAVLVVVRGMILAHTVPSAILRVPATINQDMKALVPKASVLPEYLCNAFWAQNRQILALVEKSSHDTRKLQTPALLNFRLLAPSLSEQRRIVVYLNDLRVKIDSLKQQQAETATELDALLPSVLDRAFKGRL